MRMTQHKREQQEDLGAPGRIWFWLGPLVYMLVVSIYFLGRFEGHWAESDSASFTRYIRVFAEQGRLIPVANDVYPNGYAYQAISTFVVSLTGLKVDVLQQWIYPLIAALVVFPAWVLYREVTGSDRGAALATMLLFTQPEFLFVLLRSSHEKFTRSLMLLCLFLLVRCFKLGNQPGKWAVFVGLSYLSGYALISSNNLLANSFFFAIALAFLIGWLLTKYSPSFQKYEFILKRLFYSTLIFFGLSYIFTIYIYAPPALHDLAVLGDIKNRIAALFLDVHTEPTNAYAQVSVAWVNLRIYFLLSIANWILLGVSLLIWLKQGWNWLWMFREPKNSVAWFLWLLYAAFALQGALTVLVDASGALASNLQHRIFPSFSMIAVAIVGQTLVEWRPHRLTRAIPLGLTGIIFSISILSVLKATNEPLVSNKWTFYHPNELAALQWGDEHLDDVEIWTEYDERLITAYRTVNEDINNRFTTSATSATRDMLITNLTRLRSSRIRQPLPVPPDALQVYDNGIAQLYHLRPETPYQR